MRVLECLIRGRMKKWWPSRSGEIDGVDLSPTRALLLSVSPSWAWPWLRTVSGGWLTSHRILSPRGPGLCIFGCPGSPDRQCHYAVCSRLVAAISSFLENRALASDPLSRWGFTHCTVHVLEELYIAVHMYHTLRLLSPEECQARMGSAAKAALRDLRLTRPDRAPPPPSQSSTSSPGAPLGGPG